MSLRTFAICTCGFLLAACAPSAIPTLPAATATIAPPPAIVAPPTATLAPTRTPALPTPTAVPIGQRATTDRPDDSQDYQIHAMYILASDSVDEQLDTNGYVATSIASMNYWFNQQTKGRKLRFDTFQGNLDITFFRLKWNDAQIVAVGDQGLVAKHIQGELLLAGFDATNKIYAVYYGGAFRSQASCGVSLGGGGVAVTYMHGPARGFQCESFGNARSETEPARRETSQMQEILHSLGFVPECGKNHDKANPLHVTDDSRDAMYTGGLVSLNEEVLDASHDDYFEHNIPGCLDLAKSPFIDPLPANPQPVPWVQRVQLSNLKMVDCAQEKALGNYNSSKQSPEIQVLNGTDKDVQVFRLLNGQRDPLFALKSLDQDSRTNVARAWVIADAAGACLGIIQPTGEAGRIVVR